MLFGDVSARLGGGTTPDLVVEDFEGGSLDAGWNGATSAWNFSTSVVQEGSYAGYQVNSSSTTDAIRRTDITLQQGDRLEVYFRIAQNSVPDGNIGIGYANQGASSSPSDQFDGWDAYVADISFEAGDISILRYERSVSGAASTIATTSVSIPGDTWLKGTLEWGTDDSHTWTVDEVGGSNVAQVSGSDATWTSGGAGLYTDDDSEGVNQYADYYVVYQ